MLLLPPWVWRYKQKQEQICDLLIMLLHDPSDTRYIDPFEKIEVHTMDYMTGETDPSMVEYFTPDIYTEFDIANTTLDDEFLKTRELNMKKNSEDLDTSNLHHQLYRSFAKYIRESPLGTTPPDVWELTKYVLSP